MIFDYVVVKNVETVDEKTTQEIVADGRVIAKDRDTALLHVGVELASLEQVVTDELQVLLRPF